MMVAMPSMKVGPKPKRRLIFGGGARHPPALLTRGVGWGDPSCSTGPRKGASPLYRVPTTDQPSLESAAPCGICPSELIFPFISSGRRAGRQLRVLRARIRRGGGDRDRVNKRALSRPARGPPSGPAPGSLPARGPMGRDDRQTLYIYRADFNLVATSGPRKHVL